MPLSFSYRFSPSDQTKVVISVSKKVAKKAVTRNLIKRRVRAVIRPRFPFLKIGTHMLIAKPGAGEVRGEALRKELESLLK